MTQVSRGRDLGFIQSIAAAVCSHSQRRKPPPKQNTWPAAYQELQTWTKEYRPRLRGVSQLLALLSEMTMGLVVLWRFIASYRCQHPLPSMRSNKNQQIRQTSRRGIEMKNAAAPQLLESGREKTNRNAAIVAMTFTARRITNIALPGTAAPYAELRSNCTILDDHPAAGR